jgi:pyrroline-5-carboxylate reductase
MGDVRLPTDLERERVMSEKLAVIGGLGKMGAALIDGLLAAGVYEAHQVVGTARHQRSIDRHQAPWGATLDNLEAVRDAAVVLLAVHPDQAQAVVELVRDELRPDVLVISIVTGVPTFALEGWLGGELPVIRAIPNIAAVVRAFMTALCRGRHASDEQLALASRLFEPVGKVARIDERHMDSCTGLAGCGPAFALEVIEALALGGVKRGLPRDVSRLMAAQVLRGAAELVLETGMHPAALRDQVTTPGGCTIDGITKLEERGLPIALIEAVEVSSIKAGLLRDGNGG